MRTRSVLGLTVATILAAACAHPAPEAPAPMSWSFNHTQDEGLKLVYGQPRSDNVLLMMSCQPQTGQVEVAVATSGDDAGGVSLLSRNGRLDLNTAPAPTPIEGVGLVIGDRLGRYASPARLRPDRGALRSDHWTYRLDGRPAGRQGHGRRLLRSVRSVGLNAMALEPSIWPS